MRNWGGKRIKTFDQHDYVYYEEGKQLGNLGPDPIIMRLREQDGSVILTLKQPLSNNLDCIEKETKVEDRANMHDILELLNYKLRLRIKKHREVWKYNDLEICIDDVEDLGTFIEVEKLVKNGDGAKVQDELFNFLQSLGVSKDDRVHDGYDVLLIRQKGLK